MTDKLPFGEQADEFFRAQVRLYKTRRASKNDAINQFNRLCRDLVTHGFDLEDIKAALDLEKYGEIPPHADIDRCKRVAAWLGMSVGMQLDLPLSPCQPE